MRITLRAPLPADIDWILDQLREFSDFFGTRVPLFPDPEYARTFLQSVIMNHFMLLAESETGPVGFVSGFKMPHIYNPKIRVLNEMFWWVTPSARGSRAGQMLLDAFIDHGKATADWICFTLEDKSPVRAEVLLRRGFKHHESSFLMEVI